MPIPLLPLFPPSAGRDLSSWLRSSLRARAASAQLSAQHATLRERWISSEPASKVLTRGSTALKRVSIRPF